MANTDEDRDLDEVKEQLWREIANDHLGMLQAGADSHAQPMTPFCEPETGQIWFFTREALCTRRT